MKIRKILPILLVALAMVFTACNPTSEASTTPGASQEATGTEVMSTEPASPEATATEAMSAESANTEVPATKPATTEVLPQTGKSDAGRTTALLDFDVFDQSNQQVGKVSDLVMDLGAEKIAYVIVDTTGTGSGDLIAVPYGALSVGTSDSSSSSSAQQGAFTLTVDRDVFDGAPAFDESSIPAMGGDTAGWDADLKSYWDSYLSNNSSETTSTAGMSGMALASDILALKIKLGASSQSMSLSVDDVLVDSKNGDLQYVVVSFDNAGNQKLIPIPIHLFKWDAASKAFSSTVSPDDLLKAPSFSENGYPSTSSPNWDAEFNNFWQGH
jgi:sporulation protein YlmC with PRC-barrel domain